MKKGLKVLVVLLCAVMLVAASVMGTLAYLTSQDSVENTFTIGNVTIALDEYEVDPETGLKKNPLIVVQPDANENKGMQNIKLVPGRIIEKHPFVTVKGNSESCWLFVKVENGLVNYEASGDDTVAKQLEKYGWVPLAGVADVYYYKNIVPASAEDQKFDVFTSVKIADNAESVAGWAEIATKGNIVVTAYAIQSEGFDLKDTDAENAADAWVALNP